MNKFLKWLDRNRKPIGYTCGGLNLLAAVNFYLQGQTGTAVVWTVIGAFLIWDAADYKKDHA